MKKWRIELGHDEIHETVLHKELRVGFKEQSHRS